MLKMETQFERDLSVLFVYPVRLVARNVSANRSFDIYPPLLQWHHCHKGNDLVGWSGSHLKVKGPTAAGDDDHDDFDDDDDDM
jgi:hypothetical protein